VLLGSALVAIRAMALAYSRADTHFAFGIAFGKAPFAFGNALCFLGRGVVVGIYLDNVLACSGRGLDGCHSADVGTGGIGIGY
jgi:hypothetical protein